MCFKSCPRVGGICKRLTNELIHVVSSRAPVWGASLSWGQIRMRPGVSSRAPVWGASVVEKCQEAAIIGFKSCPRVGGIFKMSRNFWDVLFQVVPPCGGHRLQIAAAGCAGIGFQVVPPCGGHPGAAGACRADPGSVSSRAPVWGASYSERPRTADRTVSSRAPVWGASSANAACVTA